MQADGHSNKQSERELHLAVANLTFVSAGRVRKLLDVFHSLTAMSCAPLSEVAAVAGISEADARILQQPLALPSIRTIVEEQAGQAIVWGDEDYPPLLREIADPPLVLYARGVRSVVTRHAVAIVGSRRPTEYGRNVARLLARELAARGVVVASGFARGIDAEAHAEALRCGGSTVAVVGTGVDVDYPREHRRLRRDLLERGCLLSEFMQGTPPRPEHFPIRNRIIAGMSLGVIVVEATERSGSLITARLASEQGREVFAVPGSIFAAQSVGPHKLLQSGAKLVRCIDDVLEELDGIAAAMPLAHSARQLTAAQAEVLSAVQLERALSLDEIASATNRSTSALAEVLLQLELDGMIRSTPGARYVRCV